MTQTITVVAMNFQDLVTLKGCVGNILRRVSKFRDETAVAEFNSKTRAVTLTSKHSTQCYEMPTPNGVDEDTWMSLLAQEFLNLLYATERLITADRQVGKDTFHFKVTPSQ